MRELETKGKYSLVVYEDDEEFYGSDPTVFEIIRNAKLLFFIPVFYTVKKFEGKNKEEEARDYFDLIVSKGWENI